MSDSVRAQKLAAARKKVHFKILYSLRVVILKYNLKNDGLM